MELLETIFKEAYEADYSVCLDREKQRLIFLADGDEYQEIFEFMDAHKIETTKGAIYPISFLVASNLKDLIAML